MLDYSKVIEIEPRNLEAYFRRGRANYWKGKYTQAILDLSKAIEMDPSNAEAHFWRSKSYYFTKEYDKELEDLNKAQSLGYKVDQEYLKYLRESSLSHP